MHTYETPCAAISTLVALSVNAVSVFNPCMPLRGLGDKGCHLIESHLQYWEDEGCLRPMQQY